MVGVGVKKEVPGAGRTGTEMIPQAASESTDSAVVILRGSVRRRLFRSSV